MAAAAALAAELPAPEPMGRPLSSSSSTPMSTPAAVNTAWAAMPAQLRAASRGSRPSSPLTAAIRSPRPGTRRANTVSPGPLKARPSTS